jgi:Fe-S-cluster-containing dehydrogenase component/DMSO reductase anchor subunit
VGTLHGSTPTAAVLKTVSSACHHCVDPACMHGCPVDAYEKDPITGIVRHLDDQCIGCQYCTLTCPYEVPQYNAARGIVRKCDMCQGRLAAGEAPACVQACPQGAITITVVDTARAIEDAEVDAFLPGAPSPGITVPTTTYKSKKPLPRNTLPADFYAERPAHIHRPLVWLLVLTQLSVGAFAVDLVLRQLGVDVTGLSAVHAGVALALGHLALGASIFHLGRPLYAFRAILGIRTSWMSREVAAFGLFAGLATAYAVLLARDDLARLPLVDRVIGFVPELSTSALEWLGLGVVGAGALGILCSVMLYAVTGKRWWGAGRTTFRFASTATLLGLGTTIVTTAASATLRNGGVLGDAGAALVRDLVRVLLVVAPLVLVGEAMILLHLRDKQHGELRRTAMLLLGRLQRMTFFRGITTVFGGVIVPFVFLFDARATDGTGAIIASVLAFALLLVGELLERNSFFAALSAPRMPGGSV